MNIPFSGNGFKSVAERSAEEKNNRVNLKGKLLKFGVHFLDLSFRGIFPNDLILIGAPSGIGKTQFCVNMALKNIEDGKRVHFIALEADDYEIERRLKYSIVANSYFADHNRPSLSGERLSYVDWAMGEYEMQLRPYESLAETLMGGYKDLFTFYKQKEFGYDELIENALSVAMETDLIIVDHVHYFDFEDDNENRAVKKIAKTAREICQLIGKPIVLVAHLRKRDRKGAELIAGIDEFHGSSDLTKIATKIVTIAPGNAVAPGKYETYFRIPKSRMDGGVTRYVAKLIYDSSMNAYQDEFMVGVLKNNGTEFSPLAPMDVPFWLRSSKIAVPEVVEPKPIKKTIVNYAPNRYQD